MSLGAFLRACGTAFEACPVVTKPPTPAVSPFILTTVILGLVAVIITVTAGQSAGCDAPRLAIAIGLVIVTVLLVATMLPKRWR